ncbi:MAG: helix-turn-helix domain-containing protein, partial [Pseudomonadota bacterium]
HEDALSKLELKGNYRMPLICRMDGARAGWYLSNMSSSPPIPEFTLFGETDHFPDVVHCEGYSARASAHGWKISAHRHAKLAQLFEIEAGSVQATVDGRDIRLKSGEFLFVPAQFVHEFDFEPETEGKVLSFPLSVLSSIGPRSADVNLALNRVFFGPMDDVAAQLTDALAATLGGAMPFRQQTAVGLAHAVLSHLANVSANVGNSDHAPARERLARLDELIADHQADGWSATDYAAALALSTGHLSRLCRSATGMGASAYIERSIMEEACRLLAFTHLPVAEIGYRLGFSDPSYFSKRFRVIRRQTPSEYRRRFVN